MIVLLLAVFLFEARKGTHRWIPLGPAGVQPSELAKLAIIVFLASMIERKGEMIHAAAGGLVPCYGVAGFLAGLVFLEPDLGTSLVLMLVTTIVMFAAGMRARWIAAIGGTVALALPVLIFSASYRARRLLAFLHPEEDLRGPNFQLFQSKIAIGSGGVFGSGFGQGQQKWLFLPEAHTDFIFSVVGEELGLLGTLFLLSLFILLFWRGMRVTLRAPDRLGRFLALGITMCLVCQAFTNMAVATGLLPTKGLPLPFISYGGSSLVVTLGMAGILLNIAAIELNHANRLQDHERMAIRRMATLIVIAGGRADPSSGARHRGGLRRRDPSREILWDRSQGSRRALPAAGFPLDAPPARAHGAVDAGERLSAERRGRRGALHLDVPAASGDRDQRRRVRLKPAVLAAVVLAVPTMIHEQNAVGLTNRWLGASSHDRGLLPRNGSHFGARSPDRQPGARRVLPRSALRRDHGDRLRVLLFGGNRGRAQAPPPSVARHAGGREGPRRPGIRREAEAASVREATPAPASGDRPPFLDDAARLRGRPDDQPRKRNRLRPPRRACGGPRSYPFAAGATRTERRVDGLGRHGGIVRTTS
jgi:cell division protein FtsW